MSDTIRFAIVGAGDIAGFYMEAFQKRTDISGIEFAGAWNRSPGKAESLCEKYGGTVYASLEELLADDSVDMLLNLTSPLVHFELSKKILEAGKHLHSEKPLGLNVEECDILIQIAQENNVKCACAPFITLGHMQQKVKQLLDEGRIGTPYGATAEKLHGRIEAWHPSPQQFYVKGGGPVWDTGPYPFALMQMWFGQVESIQALGMIAIPERRDLDGNPFDVTVPDHAYALLTYENGVIARVTFSSSNCATDNTGIEVQGTEGSLRLSDVMDAECELKISEDGSNEWDHIEGDPSGKYASGVDWSAGIIELADAIREDREPFHSAHKARHAVAIAAGIDEAIKTGEKIRM